MGCASAGHGKSGYEASDSDAHWIPQLSFVRAAAGEAQACAKSLSQCAAVAPSLPKNSNAAPMRIAAAHGRCTKNSMTKCSAMYDKCHQLALGRAAAVATVARVRPQ